MGESNKAFNARLVNAVGRRLDELKKKTKGLTVVYKKDADIVKAIKDDIENRHLKEEALKLLDKLGQGAAELNPLGMVFQFKKFNLDQYMGEPQTVFGVLLYEIARTILKTGFREQRYQDFSDPVRSIIRMARGELIVPTDLIKWENLFVQSIFEFIHEIELGELVWENRLDFNLWPLI